MTAILNKVQQRKTIHCHHHKIHFATGKDAAWPRMGNCALLQCLTASPVWRNQSTPSLTWSAKGAKCFQAIFNIEKLGIFSISLSFYFFIWFSICDLHFYCWQMAEQYPGNITRQSFQEQKAEHTVFFQSVLGVTSREQLLDSLVQFLNPLLRSLYVVTAIRCLHCARQLPGERASRQKKRQAPILPNHLLPILFNSPGNHNSL